MATRKKKEVEAPTVPVVEAPVVEGVVPSPIVELPNIVKVKNTKGVEFSVSKAYYLINKHKLEIVNA